MNTIIKSLTHIDHALAFFMGAIVTILGVFIAFSMVAGIILRSFLDIQFFGLEELVLIAAIWLYMLGAALASRERTHLSADFFQSFSKSAHLQAYVKTTATFISVIMALFFINWSYSLFSWGLEKKQVTPVFSIPQYVSQGSLFIASILLLIYSARDLVKDIINTIKIHKKTNLSGD